MPSANDIMVKDVVTVKEDDSIRDLSRLLIAKKMSGVPVLNKSGKLVGFVSEKDIMTAVSQGNIAKKKIKSVMVKKVITAAKDTPMEDISKIFSEKPVRCIPVLEGEKIIGVVLRKDVINRLLGHYY